MTSSLPIQSPVEPASDPVRTPDLELCGVKVFVDRDGDHVTGKVAFPHVVGGDLDQAARAYREGTRVTGRTECPIDYRSTRPSDHPSSFTLHPSDARTQLKLSLVRRYLQVCANAPNVPKLTHARSVVTSAKAEGAKRISVRSLQSWAAKYDREGEAALRDSYTRPTPKVPTFDIDHAKHALLVCAWWSYRIGNVDVIDTRMMALAVRLFSDDYKVADLIATIDCYYSYPCNRERYPFKPFTRWVVYALRDWLLRAADAADYRQYIAQGRRERTPLQAVARPRNQRSTSATATRKQQAADFRTRAEIANLAGPSEPPAGDEATDTIALALAGLEDQWRGMLLRAAGRPASSVTRQAIEEAAATLPLWWDHMPTSITHNIDACVDQWSRDHPTANDLAANARRFRMFLPHLRDTKTAGFTRLPIAAPNPHCSDSDRSGTSVACPMSVAPGSALTHVTPCHHSTYSNGQVLRSAR